MLNPFFLQGSKNEQGLIQDLINEHLKIYGVEVYYLPRKYITEKTVIKEVIESVFDVAYPIEAYVDTYEGYSENPTILSKFGIQALNEIALTISKERFETYISPLIKNAPNIKLSTRPKEGDLIYFPLGDRIFEIKYVEHEKPFYQLQKNYVYQLRCELFRYEDEIIDTSISEIDDNLEGFGDNLPLSGIGTNESMMGNTQKLIMVGAGVTAQATATTVNGGIRSITVTNRGGGYSYPPRVAISSAPSGTGRTGIATAIMIGGIVVCNDNTNPNLKSVQSVEIINAGFGYTVAPKVAFFGDGSGATAVASIGNGVIGSINIVNGGSGYVNPPNISFVGVSSVGAAATAVINSAGSITSIRITNAGLGYSQAPTIVISSPPSQSTGSFVFNEIVTGSQSGTTARVKRWNAQFNELEVYKISGSFINGETIVGSESNASFVLRYVDRFQAKDGYTSNADIENAADNIIDFSESNPFGNP